MSTYAKNSALNLLFNYSNVAFNVVTGIFLVPLYLHKIPLDLYGSYLVAVAISVLIGLLEFGLSLVITQRLAHSYAQADWTSFKKTSYSGLIAALLLFALSCAATLTVSTQVIWLTNVGPAHASDLRAAFLLLGLAAGVNIFLNLFGSVLQALLKAGPLGAINFASAAFGVAIAVAAFVMHPSLVAIASGPLARVLFATLLLLATAFRYLTKQSLLPSSSPFSATIKLARSCGPVFLGGVSRSIAENLQSFLLAHTLSPTAVAVLALTQRAILVCNMILAPIGSSIYSNLTQLKQKTTHAHFSFLIGMGIRTHFLLSVSLIATASVFNGAFVSLWVGSDKFGGLWLSLLIGLSTLLMARFSFLGFIIYSTGEFKKPLALEVGYALTKIAVLYAAIGRVGIYTAPVADIIAGMIFFFFFGTRLVLSKIQTSVYSAGLYYKGWLEFIFIAFAGYYTATLIGLSISWPVFIESIVLFQLAVVLCVIAMNFSFFKGVLSFRKRAAV